jgi:hypothetical protein
MASTSSTVFRSGSELPAVDDRLVAPGTRYEIHDGVLVHVAPADPPHATRHSKISALVEAHAGAAFEVASDMLTRTSRTSDIAPDVSVFPLGPDPVTGGRQLEQLAFEVASTESLGHAGHKAAKLVSRGVRRVFAIDVERGRALEWSAALARWSALDPGAQIEDPALAAPLPIEALVSAAKSDDAVARALLIKRNPVLEQVRMQDRAEGVAEGVAEGLVRGRADALLVMLDARGIALHGADRARILGQRDPDILARWIGRAATATSAADLFDER